MRPASRRRRVGRRGAGTPRRPIVAARKGRSYRLGSRAAALRSSALVRLPRLKKKERNQTSQGRDGRTAHTCLEHLEHLECSH